MWQEQGHAESRLAWCQSAPGESAAQLLSSPRQSTLNGSDRAAEMTRDFIVTHTLEVAEDQGQAVVFGKSMNLFIDHRTHLGLLERTVRFSDWLRFGAPLLDEETTPDLLPFLVADPKRDSM